MKYLALILVFSIGVFAQEPALSPQPTPEIKADLVAMNKPAETAAYELKGFTAAALAAKAPVQTSSEPKLMYRGGRLRLLQSTYTPWNGTRSYFTIGSNVRRTWPDDSGLVAIDIGLPLTINGNAKYYVGQRIAFDVQGSPTSPFVTGQQVSIFSNSLFPGGTGSLKGVEAVVDVGGPVSSATGGHFGAATGSVGAVGTGTLTGLLALTSVHNAGTTNVFTGDFWLASSSSSPAATVTNAYALRLRARIDNAVTFTNLRFISLAETALVGTGAVGTSYGLYADTTIDVGATRYFIYSTSTSPSRFAGDVRISDTTKGIILTSPDGTCYRFTVANGGALSAGAAVTCQ